MSIVYVYQPQSYMHIEDNRLIIEVDDLKRMIPLEKIEGILLYGGVGISSRCITKLLEIGVPLTWLSKRGNFYGRLESTRNVNITRQRQQFKLGENEEFCLRLAINFISAKTNNQIVLLRRYNRTARLVQVAKIIDNIKILRQKIEMVNRLDKLLGYEGACARLYFKALSLIVDNKFAFCGRTKRPPKDPFNSLLSFGYTLLMYEAYTAIASKGLNPYAGFMHQDREKHPTLASDLMEEWRPVIVDSLVLNMVQGRIIKINDFDIPEEKSKGVYLKEKASKKFIKNFEKRVRTQHNYLNVPYSMNFRRSIVFQAGMLSRALEENDADIYKPIMIR
ncbi:MAG: CRISPR-associated endonuclease Cas1 [Clostridia bacterium]|nr:CRISPR-associated endonuclease Cas1 [Clostridia bacterium]